VGNSVLEVPLRNLHILKIPKGTFAWCIVFYRIILILQIK